MPKEDRAALRAFGCRTVELLDRVAGLLEDLVAIAASALRSGSVLLPDDALPVHDDGACKACGSRRVRIPEEQGRQAVRVCSVCQFTWRVADGETDVHESAP